MTVFLSLTMRALVNDNRLEMPSAMASLMVRRRASLCSVATLSFCPVATLLFCSVALAFFALADLPENLFRDFAKVLTGFFT